MRSTIAVLTLIAAVTDPAVGQTVRGVWKPIEVVVDTGADRGRHTTDVQPGLLIFSKRHYSMTFVAGFTPRAIPSDSATDEQLGLSFLRFTANAGTYEQRDSTITFNPSVAKHPAVMVRGPFTVIARLKGDTLRVKLGGNPAGQQWTWLRVERP
jgi:hypothetical protein